MRLFRSRPWSVVLFSTAVLVIAFGYYFRPVRAQSDTLTPGMLFGPILVDQPQYLELCSSYLSAGDLTQVVHFRNLTTGEVTKPETLIIPSGGGACARYKGRGLVVGMARGDLPEAEWVSPSNALIGTMSLVDPGQGVRVTVSGIAKFWLKGL